MRLLTAARQGLKALVLIAFAMGSPAVGGAFRCCVEGRHAAAPTADAPEGHSAHHAPADGQDSAPTSPCDCVGACHMADPVLVADAVDVGAVLASGPRAPAAPRAALLFVERAAHALPFAHAPPGVLS